MLRRLLIPVLLVSPAFAGTPCHVIIMSGQSNMVGDEGLGELVHNGFDFSQPQTDVLEDYNIDLVENAAGWHPLQPHTEVPNTTYGCELSFGRDLTDDGPGVQVAIIKVAVGGSNLASRWDPDNHGDLYDNLIDQVTRSLNELVSLGYDPLVTGFGWWQGDADLWVPEWTAAYQDNLTYLVANVRADLGAPDMHVLVVQTPIGQDKPADLVAIMRQAKADFVAADPHASLIDTDDLTFRDNGIHIDGAGRLIVGERMAAAYIADSVFGGAPCDADLDSNGQLDIDDINMFSNAFFAGSPVADITADGTLNLDDINRFATAFIAGCP